MPQGMQKAVSATTFGYNGGGGGGGGGGSLSEK